MEILCEISRFPEMKLSDHHAGEVSLGKPVYGVVKFSRACFYIYIAIPGFSMVMKGHGHLAFSNGYLEFLMHLLTNSDQVIYLNYLSNLIQTFMSFN